MLTGSVTSAAEGAMEGVLVTAQRDDSPISTTVVSDASGRFRFPDGRLRSGHYRLRIRATGYELDGPQVVDLGTSATNVAIKLRQTSDLAAQLTNAEWFMSRPGTAEQKRPLIECMSCHTFERIARSTYETPTLSSRCSSAWRNMPTIRHRRACSPASPRATSMTILCASSPLI